MKRLLTAGLAALVLVASQAAAVEPDRSLLSAADRAASPSDAANEQFSGYNPVLITIIVIALGLGIYALSNYDGPNSP